MLDLFGSGGDGGLHRMKPGLLFLLRLAWDSRARLPLLIMSGLMALGVRVQMEINIDNAAQFMPRLRLEDDAGPPETDSEDDSEVIDLIDSSDDWSDDDPLEIFETDFEDNGNSYDEVTDDVFSDEEVCCIHSQTNCK